jgi:hypothetical protein
MNEYLAERELWWPVNKKLLTSYLDRSHTKDDTDGTLEWFKNGNRHRDDDKPAVIYWDGSLTWYKNGEQHRDNDKPAVISRDGKLEWCKNGKWHRDGDMPAVIGADDELLWYKNSLLHRVTGPAMINSNTEHKYWINGDNITEEVNAWLKTRKYKYPFTPEQQVEFTLTFG